MAARLLAALLAAAMVVGAFAARRAIFDSDGDGGGNGNAGDRGGNSSRGTRAACAEELGDVCIDADLAETAGTTADMLAGAEDAEEADVRTWLTVGPWPQMVDEARKAGGQPAIFTGRGRALASSELVAVVARQPAACATELTWKCLGDAIVAGTRVAAPARGSGTRLLVTAAFAGGYLGRSDYASNDLTDDPAVADWLAAVDRGIEQARGFGATSVTDFLVKRGSADVFLTTLADARTSGAFEPTISRPTPTVYATAVMGATGPFDADDAVNRLQLFHWVAPPARATGLPSPGVLLALREVGG